MSPIFIPILIAALLLIPFGIVAVVYLIVPLFKAIGFIIRQSFRFLAGEIGDALRIVGALVTQAVLLPLIILNIVIGRWSAAGHFGRAVSAEARALGVCAYRMLIGHPARLLCMTALTDGIERRIPAAIAAAPGADAPSARRAGQFEGYTIVGSLPGGGSGGKLFVAEPDAMKRAIFERTGQRDVRQVVIKTFSLRDGSSLPQIVRESRALDAAKRLGLVLDHELTGERFFYVMRYVPGESLGLVTQRLHASGDGEGLTPDALASAMTYGSDLLHTLHAYHSGGLWHKDVKPDNIIVDGRSAHLVDFGLLTPLRSAMTLTTHGTEYFRDPEMVRLALKGVKVDQVDGARFDIYAVGAVLFSVIENSFPAHGGLSQITRRCPEALRWIVRRAMTDYDKRYPSAAAMLTDIEHLRRAADPFAVKPFELPSMGGVEDAAAPAIRDDFSLRRTPEPVAIGDGSGEVKPEAPFAAPLDPPAPRRRPRLRVDRWWTGGYVREGEATGSPAREGMDKVYFAGAGAVPPAAHPRVTGLSAREQIEHARSRVKAARERARNRIHQRRPQSSGDFSTINVGVGFAVLLFLAVCVGLVMLLLTGKSPSLRITNSPGDDSTPAIAFARGDLPQDGDIPGVSSARRGTPRLLVNGRAVSPIGPGSAAAISGEKALVISDIQPQTPAITAAIHRLQTAGFSLIGNYAGNTATGEGLADQVALEAEAKQVRGLGLLESEDVSQQLSVWLADRTDLGVLVWFAKGGDDGSTQYHVITPALPKGADDRARRRVFSTSTESLAGRLN